MRQPEFSENIWGISIAKIFFQTDPESGASVSPASHFSVNAALKGGSFISATSPLMTQPRKQVLVLEDYVDPETLHFFWGGLLEQEKTVLNYLGSIGFRILLCTNEVGIIEYLGCRNSTALQLPLASFDNEAGYHEIYHQFKVS